MKPIKTLLAASVAALAFAVPMANATLYTDTFQGVTFDLNAVNGANSFTLEILNFGSANGDWTGVNQIGALAFKGLGADGTDYTASLATIAPGTATSSSSELNSNGCTGGDSGGICFTFNPLFDVTGTNLNDLIFTINLGAGGALNITTPHLKVNFDKDGTQIGSLLSADLPVASSSSSSSSSGGGESSSSGVPEPGTSALALLGLGLLAGSFVMRKARQG